jgi:hypothetical protein
MPVSSKLMPGSVLYGLQFRPHLHHFGVDVDSFGFGAEADALERGAGHDHGVPFVRGRAGNELPSFVPGEVCR